MQLTQKHLEYWSRNLRTTGVLLFIWFVATFVVGYFAREINAAVPNFFGWPLGFFMCAFGSLVIYVLIIWYYASYMGRLDREYGVDEGEE
jgi:putative solute:sodium symporter small subunit